MSIELRPNCWPGTSTRHLRPIPAAAAPTERRPGGSRDSTTRSRSPNTARSAVPGSRRQSTSTRPQRRFAAATPHSPGVPRMAEASGNTAPTAEEIEATADAGLVSQLDMMLKALWASPARGAIIWITGAAVAVVAVTAYGQIRLNNWNQPFYDALSRREFAQFLMQLGVFGLIAGAASGAQRGAALARRDPEAEAARRPGAGSDRQLAAARPGVPAGQRRPDGRQPRSAHARGRAPPHRAVGRLGIGLLQSSILLVTFVGDAVETVERLRLPLRHRSHLRFRATWCGPPWSIRGRPRC